MDEERTYRILFADHDKDDLVYLHKISEKMINSSIDIAVSAKDTVLFIDYHAYDLILAHAELPELQAESFMNYTQQSFLNSKTPIIFHIDSQKGNFKNIQKIQNELYNTIDQPFKELNLTALLRFYLRQIDREKEIFQLLQTESRKRELLELELKNSKEDFQNIVEKSHVGILIVDQEGIIRFINDIGQQIFLRKKEELVGSPFGILFDYDTKNEISIVRKNGEVGVGEISSARTQWKGQAAQLILINDITSHKKLQENLEIAKEKAQESDRLKTAFLANMSHEIRTPLNGILGFSQLLEHQELNPDKKQFFLESIHACGNHLLDIINDIIDIAQIESGLLKIVKTDFDALKVMQEIYELFRIHPKIIANNIQLNFHILDLVNLSVFSDSTRFRQILVNLINNAVKFTEKGLIDVGVSIIHPDKIQFYIKDTGIGILDSEHENIFLRFRQASENKERLNEGNGLGLSISKALVELLGGKIWMKSKIGEGSVFYFTLPLKKSEYKGSDKSENIIQCIRQKQKVKKILVVEDDEINFLFIQSIINDMATTILWAKDGLEAVNIARNENVDLVLMDMKLPIMNGYDATKEIRLMFPDLPIIAQTAYAMGGDKEKVIAAGCNDYITKPIKINDLLYKMNSLIN